MQRLHSEAHRAAHPAGKPELYCGDGCPAAAHAPTGLPLAESSTR